MAAQPAADTDALLVRLIQVCDDTARKAREALGIAPGSLTVSERDLVLRDLGQLLEAVGIGDHARPQSPHEVFQMALAGVTSLRDRTAAAIRAQKQQCPDHPMPFPEPLCWTCGRNGAFERAARIAGGEQA